MDDKWSEGFVRPEAMFLAKSFQVPVEPVKNSDVVVTDKPFIPPTPQSTGVTSVKQPSGAASKRDVKTATQPVEVPVAVLATRPVEAPGAAPVTHTTGQEADLPAAFDRPEVQPPGPDDQPSTTTLKQSAISLPSSAVPVEEPAVESDQFSDRASSLADEGEVSDMESTGPDREELLDVDQELTAEETYQETLRGVRSFMAWNDIPEFDSSSSSQDDNPFIGSKSSHTSKVSVKVPVDEWLCRKMEKLNITVQEGYPSRTSENAGLSRDQFVKPPKTLKWYGMHCEKKDFSRSIVQSFHLYSQPSREQQESDRKQGLPAWKQLGSRRRGQRSHRGKAASSFSQLPVKTQKQYK